MKIDANQIIDEADEKTGRWKNHARPAANWFHENEGTLFEREEVVIKLAAELGETQSIALETIRKLVGDIVDPVVQVPFDGIKHVGIVEYKEFDGAYGYVNFNDVRGREKRVVCAQCVHDEDYDTNVTHATAGDPAGSFDEDATYEDLYDAILEHYSDSHSVVPENVETGATLASGTTIGGNISFHSGNDGTGSGLDADLLQGSNPGAYESAMYGTGSDGDVTDPASISNIVNAQSFTITSGTTTDISSNTVLIQAQESVTINGTLNGKGAVPGGSGGSGADRFPGGGSKGADGLVISLDGTGGAGKDGTVTSAEDGTPNGAGGGGGGCDGSTNLSSLNASGGGGGDGGVGGSRSETDLTSPFNDLFQKALNDEPLTASGGGGGGAAGNADDRSGSDGGDGGGAGATIVIVSPEIEVNGTINSSGEDGQNGSGSFKAGGSGGGGGGAGGALIYMTNVLNDGSSTYNFSAGTGGAGGGANTNDGFSEGGDGSDGVPGIGKIHIGK